MADLERRVGTRREERQEVEKEEKSEEGKAG